LDSYKPNETFYLPESIRQHLEAIGGVNAIQQPAGTYAKKIMHRVLIDLSWNSSRLEGNTYSLLETERLLFNQESAENKNAAETQMILNHKAAIEFLVDMAQDIRFNAYTILNLHALLSHNLLVDPMACGRLRTIPVSIGKAAYQPLDIPALIDECFHQILDKASAIHHPFERAFFVMVHLPYLQPFEDVNKRVARLSANIPLIQNNLSPLSFIDVPERAYIDAILGVYELNQIELLRDFFVWAYERSAARYSTVRQSLGEPDLFRLQYHTLITEAISGVIQKRFDKKQADLFIKEQANKFFTEKERARFVEVVETEINALHEGNIARFRINLSDFQTWHRSWC
jgi:Fic family protein